MPVRNQKVVSISIDPYLLECWDKQADALHLTRSAYIAELVKLVESGKLHLTNDVVNGVRIG